MEGLKTNSLIIGTSKHKALKKKKAKGCTWTFFIKYILATNQFLPLLMIFKGKSV